MGRTWLSSLSSFTGRSLQEPGIEDGGPDHLHIVAAVLGGLVNPTGSWGKGSKISEI